MTGLAKMTRARILRELAKGGMYGQPCKPSGFYLSEWRAVNDSNIVWRLGDLGIKVTPQFAFWLVRFVERYHRFHTYLTQVLPGWTETRRVNYADNSVESEQVCKCGQHRRTVMVDGPHGDVCY